MQHLADEFSGQLFDGSVVQCFHLCHAVRHIESRDVVLGSVFATTAKLLCQDPLFFFMDDGKESDDNGAAVLGRRAELREAAVRASSAVMSEAFPLHKFLSGTPCPSKRTVLVLRSIDSPRTVNCVTPVTKPALFLYLEECCQYGKVLSYFVYTQLGSEGDEGTVDFFVEFQTCEGAAEAVRQFSIRFANQMQRNGMSTRVKLFSNDLYYEGVATELRKASNKSPDERDRGGVVFGSEEDFMDISLLAE
uniref:Uncharacterized protein TCIL3000_7_4190 n=1 Tax=Trypanosoma congolense (strain IL3000) TaxID=1068625 RepID=G0UQE4_TRYCI|nr:unnamed protein product [Trypanosoma congolense IL3000]